MTTRDTPWPDGTPCWVETELLRHRVEEFHSADPSSGYAAHLAAALDYRQWHEVNVTILGPEEGQQRRLSRRAKLSQGETRFVSYVRCSPPPTAT